MLDIQSFPAFVSSDSHVFSIRDLVDQTTTYLLVSGTKVKKKIHREFIRTRPNPQQFFICIGQTKIRFVAAYPSCITDFRETKSRQGSECRPRELTSFFSLFSSYKSCTSFVGPFSKTPINSSYLKSHSISHSVKVLHIAL